MNFSAEVQVGIRGFRVQNRFAFAAMASTSYG
jgi:hypothetical protein